MSAVSKYDGMIRNLNSVFGSEKTVAGITFIQANPAIKLGMIVRDRGQRVLSLTV